MKGKLSIASAGMVDGEFKVVLSNGQELDWIQAISFDADANKNQIATVNLRILVFDKRLKNKKSK